MKMKKPALDLKVFKDKEFRDEKGLHLSFDR
jgi:hypothetical protein